MLTGLQWQLAGQLSLYAITNQPGFGRGFAEQAVFPAGMPEAMKEAAMAVTGKPIHI